MNQIIHPGLLLYLQHPQCETARIECFPLAGSLNNSRSCSHGPDRLLWQHTIFEKDPEGYFPGFRPPFPDCRTPDEGSQSTNYVYTVVYTDPDGDAPTVHNVLIDDEYWGYLVLEPEEWQAKLKEWELQENK